MNSSTRLEHPLDPSCTHISSWLRCICFGNFQIFMHHLGGKSEEEVKRLVLKRETFGNLGPLHHVVSAMLSNPAEKDKDYPIIFEKLITLGADVNAKDLLGSTPLHELANVKCADVEASVQICQMAEKLLENGADVNLKNR